MTKFLFSKITNGEIFTGFEEEDSIDLYYAGRGKEENELLYRATKAGVLYRDLIQIGRFVPSHAGWCFYPDLPDKEISNVHSGQNDYSKSVEYFMRNYFIPRFLSKNKKKEPIYY